VENRLSPRIGIVKGDEGQIQQAILNILINARDAMPEGGTITIVTDITDFNGQSGAEMRDRSSGKFVSITITDTGIGMDREIQQRIFEPFFTTKDQGKGTGLGLSVVYGVVNAHDGFITMRSAVGQGSTFSIYLPLLKEREALDAEPETASLSPGTERVLVVDDESHVGEVIAGMLTELGYNVKIARGGREAIELVEHDGSFNAVVLDMNMPEMGGKETFFRLKELNPSLRIIVSTGYSNTSIESSPLQNSIDGFLQKPYQLQELSRVLHEVFGRSQERAP
jgi:CheY-like chemotaxis protein